MKDANNISEKYRKYLLEILIDGHKYYTVSGSDLSDNEKEKLLIDSDNNILIFSTPGDLFATIQKTNNFFDNEILSRWAKEAFHVREPYAAINFDVLLINTIDILNIDLFNEVHVTLGIIGDYSFQVNEEQLLKLLQGDTLSQFKDDLADYFIWSKSKTLKISVNADNVLADLNSISEILKKRLTRK